jgi:adenylate cyclase
VAGTRKIATILAADIVGYSRLAGAEEDHALSWLRGLRSDLIDPAIDAHERRPPRVCPRLPIGKHKADGRNP